MFAKLPIFVAYLKPVAPDFTNGANFNLHLVDQPFLVKPLMNVVVHLFVLEVYRLGGRKIAFQSVGPLGSTPSNRTTTTNPSGGCVEFLLAMARRHNRALSVALHKLEKTLPGFKYSIFDYYDALLDMANSPSKYGLQEGKSACCGSGAYRGSGCGGGFRGNETFEDSWNGSPQHITGLYTVKQLFQSL
ncbi:hypothetical protein K1719_009087 [Acacia pycnantha]|nr:hypothetical protein K1719_009087 [Acacia pycnantha]